MFKKKFEAVLFDLDGTIADSSPGIFNCVRFALSSLGKDIPGEAALLGFLGPPLFISFTEICGLDEHLAEEAIRLYRSRYEKCLISENSLFEGIEETLKRLRDAGIKTAVATSKPQKIAERVIDGFNLTGYFSCVCGAAPDDKESGKSQIIGKALEILEVSDPEKAVMVGDRKYDAEGAKAAGTEFIGALYGYGSREELAVAGAVCFAGSPAEIAEIVLAG